MILVSPSEPAELRQVLEAQSSPLCEQRGADILAPTGKGLLGIQRKEIPCDFLASLEDGRLARELPLLVRGVDLSILLLEGTFVYDADDCLRVNGRPTRYNRLGIRNLLRSVFHVHGTCIELSASLQETPAVVNELIGYFSRQHLSLFARPKLQGLWGKPTPNEQVRYFYQGVPGVGVVLGQSLADRFPAPADLLSASLADLKATPGIGRQRAGQVFRFIHGGVAT